MSKLSDIELIWLELNKQESRSSIIRFLLLNKSKYSYEELYKRYYETVNVHKKIYPHENRRPQENTKIRLPYPHDD